MTRPRMRKLSFAVFCLSMSGNRDAEDFDRFVAQKLGPAIRATGLVPTTPKEIPVYNMLGVRLPAHVAMIGMVA